MHTVLVFCVFLYGAIHIGIVAYFFIVPIIKNGAIHIALMLFKNFNQLERNLASSCHLVNPNQIRLCGVLRTENKPLPQFAISAYIQFKNVTIHYCKVFLQIKSKEIG